eukprot:scaffold8.g1418.t1
MQRAALLSTLARSQLAALEGLAAAQLCRGARAGAAAQQRRGSSSVWGSAAGGQAAGGGPTATGTELQDQDLVILKGLTFHGYHGVFPEERTLGQKFVVDAVLAADLRAAGESDDLQRTINYARVYEDIREAVEGPPQQLLEAVAERLAAQLLERHPAVGAVQLGIRKPHVAVGGVVESLGIQITRRRRRR